MAHVVPAFAFSFHFQLCNSGLIAAPDITFLLRKAEPVFSEMFTHRPANFSSPPGKAGLAGRLGWLCLLGTHMHTEAHAWLCTCMRTHSHTLVTYGCTRAIGTPMRGVTCPRTNLTLHQACFHKGSVPSALGGGSAPSHSAPLGEPGGLTSVI